MKPRQISSEQAASRDLAQPDVSLSGIVDAILEVGRQRKIVLNQLRAALQSGDDRQALALARQLCGLLNEKSHRVDPRLD
jgi:hypothetical protein